MADAGTFLIMVSMRASRPLPPFQPIPVTVPFRSGRLLGVALALATVSMTFRLIPPFA
ncbi:hypothetical protein ACE2AJ_13605 [Aquihabitans daechungensis]|uniref:hypothetical protein n=1 Tax=Aquihabitans daechungensis TaxID=1052257 RepID=UPI003BA1EE0F